MQSPRPPCRRRSPSLQVRWAAGRGSRDSSAVKPRGHCPACGGGAGGGRRPGPSGAAGREGAGVAGQLPCGCHPEPQRGEVRAAPPYALRVLVLGGGAAGLRVCSRCCGGRVPAGLSDAACGALCANPYAAVVWRLAERDESFC